MILCSFHHCTVHATKLIANRAQITQWDDHAEKYFLTLLLTITLLKIVLNWHTYILAIIYLPFVDGNKNLVFNLILITLKVLKVIFLLLKYNSICFRNIYKYFGHGSNT